MTAHEEKCIIAGVHPLDGAFDEELLRVQSSLQIEAVIGDGDEVGRAGELRPRVDLFALPDPRDHGSALGVFQLMEGCYKLLSSALGFVGDIEPTGDKPEGPAGRVQLREISRGSVAKAQEPSLAQEEIELDFVLQGTEPMIREEHQLALCGQPLQKLSHKAIELFIEAPEVAVMGMAWVVLGIPEEVMEPIGARRSPTALSLADAKSGGVGPQGLSGAPQESPQDQYKRARDRRQ
jgi:hypothetical protein